MTLPSTPPPPTRTTTYCIMNVIAIGTCMSVRVYLRIREASDGLVRVERPH